MVFCTESVGSSCMPNSTRRFDSSIVMWNVVSAKLARLSQKVWTTGQFQNRLGMDSTSCWQPNEQVSLTRGTKWLTILLVLRLPLLSWGLVQQCTVGLEGGSRRHSTVRQPDSQGSQTVFLVAPCCSDLTVVYANDVLVYGLTLTRPRFDEDW